MFVRLPAYSSVQAGVRGAVVNVGLTEPALPSRGAGAGHLQEGGLEEDQAASRDDTEEDAVGRI